MKKNIKYLFLFIGNVLFILCIYFILSFGNKLGTFFNVAANETSHFYIPSNLVYIKGSYFTLDRILFLEEGQNSKAIYLSDDNISNQKIEKFFLNFSSSFYIPIELQIDDLIKRKYEKQQKNKNTAMDKNYLGNNLLEEDLIHLENYEFIAPVSGEYNILVLKEGLLNQNKEIRFLFDGEEIEKKDYNIENEKFILWDRINLSAGKHKFQVNNDNEPVEFIKSSEIILNFRSPVVLNSNSLKFSKINPTKYIVKVQNFTKEPFLLVFLESFNKNWEIFKVSDNGKHFFWSNWFKQSDFKNNHYLVNGFANSWWIDHASLEDEEVFIIEYARQKDFYFSLFIVFATLLFCFNYLIIKIYILCPKK